MSARAKTVTVVAVLTIAMLAVGFAPSRSSETGSSSSAEKNLVVVGRDAAVTTALSGSVQGIGGRILIDSVIEGDVVTFGTSLRFGPEARVQGDLIAVGGTVNGLEPGMVSGRRYTPSNMAAAIGESGGGGEALVRMVSEPFSIAAAGLKLTLLVLWLAVSVAVVLISGREVRASSLELRASPLHLFLLGVVAFTSFVLTAIVFSYLVPFGIGVVLLAILGAFAVVAKAYGMVAVFHAIGARIAAPRTHEEAWGKKRIRGDLALTIVGLLILGVIRLIPVIGNVVWITASVIGVGATLGTLFGRRDPEFLLPRGSLERGEA